MFLKHKIAWNRSDLQVLKLVAARTKSSTLWVDLILYSILRGNKISQYNLNYFIRQLKKECFGSYIKSGAYYNEEVLNHCCIVVV